MKTTRTLSPFEMEMIQKAKAGRERVQRRQAHYEAGRAAGMSQNVASQHATYMMSDKKLAADVLEAVSVDGRATITGVLAAMDLPGNAVTTAAIREVLTRAVQARKLTLKIHQGNAWYYAV